MTGPEEKSGPVLKLSLLCEPSLQTLTHFRHVVSPEDEVQEKCRLGIVGISWHVRRRDHHREHEEKAGLGLEKGIGIEKMTGRSIFALSVKMRRNRKIRSDHKY